MSKLDKDIYQRQCLIELLEIYLAKNTPGGIFKSIQSSQFMKDLYPEPKLAKVSSLF